MMDYPWVGWGSLSLKMGPIFNKHPQHCQTITFEFTLHFSDISSIVRLLSTLKDIGIYLRFNYFYRFHKTPSYTRVPCVHLLPSLRSS